MKQLIVTVAMLALAACTNAGDAGGDEESKGKQKKKDPVAGFLGNAEGVRRGSDDAFGNAADATR